MKALDLVGHRYGRLTVLNEAARKNKKRAYKCQCDCGAVLVTLSTSLRSGKTQSCGCLKKETFSSVITKHGLRYQPEYIIWSEAKQRCNNPRNRAYTKYGERGISMCKEWENSFPAFIKDMGQRTNPKFVIGRIDSDGPYSPENCKWMTRKDQRMIQKQKSS